MNRKKQLKKSYKETAKLMGVYRIFNKVDERSVLDASADVAAKLNRHRAELQFGSHRNKSLQADWKRLGSDAFSFEIVEALQPLDTPDYDPSEDLEALLLMTLELDAFAAEKRYTNR